MHLQTTLTRRVGLAAAATLALGLVTATAAEAAPAHASASVANDTLTILGTPGDDDIQVLLGGTNTVVVDFGNGTQAQSFDSTSFSAIAVFLRAGDDTLRVGNGLGGEALTVNAGAGNDTINGGDGNDIIFGGTGDDVIDGGRGNDIEVLGGGNDTAVWNPGDGNDVVTGGGGYDKLQFNGSNAPENITLSANGSQAVLRRDVAAIRMDLDGVEDVAVNALGAADVLTVNDLSGTDVRRADLDLAATGGAPDASTDSVTVNGTNTADRVDVAAQAGSVDVSGLHTETTVSGSDLFDQLQVNAGGGNDRVQVSDAAAALMGINVDLGTGQR